MILIAGVLTPLLALSPARHRIIIGAYLVRVVLLLRRPAAPASIIARTNRSPSSGALASYTPAILALPAKGVAKPSPSIILPACQDRICRQLLPTRSQVPGLAPWGSHVKQRVPYAAFVQTVALIPQLTYARTALYCCARTRNCVESSAGWGDCVCTHAENERGLEHVHTSAYPHVHAVGICRTLMGVLQFWAKLPRNHT